MNVSQSYLDYFQSLWILSGCESLTYANETSTELWTSTTTQMALAASNFFYLGNYSVDYKIQYLFSQNSSTLLDFSYINLVPWSFYLIVIILLFLLILFFLFCCQVFCIKKYRLFARCCMIDLNSFTSSPKEKYGLFSCIAISGMLMIMAIVLMIYNYDIFQGYDDSKCYMYNLAIEVYTPYPNDYNWLGTIGAMSKISNASSIYEEIATDENLVNSSFINTTDAFEEYKTILQQFETNLSIYYNRTLLNPNPLTNLAVPNISSTFLSNWGPSTQTGTVLYFLKSELKTRKTYLLMMEQALQDAAKLVNQSQNYSEILTLREVDFEILGENFGDAFLNLTDVYAGEGSELINLFDSMMTVLVLNVLTMTFGLLGFIMVGFCKWRVCNCCLHCAWILNCLMLFVLLIILFIGFFFSSLAVWGCQIYEASIANPEAFSQVSTELNLNANLSQALGYCLFNSSKNLANFYSFGSSLSMSDEMFATVTSLSNSSLSSNYLENDISTLEDFYENYELLAGISSSTTENHPTTIMETLNLWSNYESVGSYQEAYGECEVSADEYVFNEDKCIYDDIYEPTQEVNINFGETLCISFNDTTENFATLRYTDVLFDDCSTNLTNFNSVPQAIKEYYIGLYKYKETTQALIEEIIESLGNYKGNLIGLDGEIMSLYNESIAEFASFNALFEVTSDSRLKGLSQGLNCSFLHEGLVKIEDSLCITTLDGIFYWYVTLMFLLLLQMILAVIHCMASIRVLPRDFDTEDEGKVLIEKNSGLELRRHSILY